MTVIGKFRVYFNRHGADPLMWCISPEDGSWEMAVKDVKLSAIAQTVYRKKETPDDEDGRPSAWIAITGRLVVPDGRGPGFASIGDPE